MEGSSDSGPTPAPRGGKSTPQAKKPQQGTVKQNKKTVSEWQVENLEWTQDNIDRRIAGQIIPFNFKRKDNFLLGKNIEFSCYCKNIVARG